MSLFPTPKIPYFIWAPGYTNISSGVRTLHLLCHALNEMGQRAYLIPENPAGYITNPDLNTPILFPQHWNFYNSDIVEPIMVYPDTVRGNPINAKRVLRYLLAPRGAYGGDAAFPETDMVWGALPAIADNVLRLPVCDPTIFFDSKQERSGSCFYAHKYDRIHGNQLLPITEGMTRLEGSPKEIADILRRSKMCYLYELTSVITEASLCGCPVTLIRSDYFNKIDNTCMMGNVKWSDGEMVKECDDYLPEYNAILSSFYADLVKFIAKTQEFFA